MVGWHVPELPAKGVVLSASFRHAHRLTLWACHTDTRITVN